ncbi:ferredoxin-type protein NapF [uncultured Ferrimonas sp.]|uniref:ferredoxin-type protein NapF n=1 Tax=uncultured Ferrimonas sp. TaxID=432640 RepID=UPI0026157CBE|nr:ferredoxin-type protein NapF [uncultured Ferrimonas sp.]
MFDPSRRSLFARHRTPVSKRLPWVVAEPDFLERCSRCNHCVNACETNIIVHADGGYPQVDFSRGECTFCGACAQACPEALFADTNTAPWPNHISISQQCLAQQNIECRSCGDQCQPMAIQFKLAVGAVAQPQLQQDSCNGCGACIAGCPTAAISMISPQEN